MSPCQVTDGETSLTLWLNMSLTIKASHIFRRVMLGIAVIKQADLSGGQPWGPNPFTHSVSQVPPEKQNQWYILRNGLIRLIVGTCKSEIHRASWADWRVKLRVDVSVLHLKPRNSGRISTLPSRGRVPSFLGNLSICSIGLQLLAWGMLTLWKLYCSQLVVDVNHI